MSDNNKRPTAKTTKSMFFVGPATQVYPDRQEDVEPKAERNVLKVTEHCMQVLTLKGRAFSGRGSGVWWLIWMSMVAFYLFALMSLNFYLSKGPEALPQIKENLLIGAGGILFFNLVSFYWYIRWRRILPVCFNRTTRTVSTWYRGHFYQIDWDSIEAHIKVMRVVGPHVPVKEGRLAINFYKDNIHDESQRLELPIAGTEKWSMSPREGAYMTWEYIRLFMQEGKHAIPEPLERNKVLTWKDAFKVHTPFPLIKKDSDTFVWILVDLVLIPFNIIMAPISIPTELIYMGLDKILPKRKPPKALKEACEATE